MPLGAIQQVGGRSEKKKTEKESEVAFKYFGGLLRDAAAQKKSVSAFPSTLTKILSAFGDHCI